MLSPQRHPGSGLPTAVPLLLASKYQMGQGLSYLVTETLCRQTTQALPLSVLTELNCALSVQGSGSELWPNNP